MPCRFQASRCAASEELAISTAWTLLAYSWPMRWNTRSAPVRSTRTSMPPNFSLNEAAIFSDTDRSIEVYQTTLPSFFAASISCAVIASGGGASARAGEANTVPSASAVEACSEPCSTSRLESFRVFMASSASSFYRLRRLFRATPRHAPAADARPAALGRQRQPDLCAFGHRGLGWRGHAQCGAVGHLDHVVARHAEIDLTRHHRLDRILRRERRLRRKLDVVLADRHRRTLA